MASPYPIIVDSPTPRQRLMNLVHLVRRVLHSSHSGPGVLTLELEPGWEIEIDYNSNYVLCPATTPDVVCSAGPLGIALILARWDSGLTNVPKLAQLRQFQTDNGLDDDMAAELFSMRRGNGPHDALFAYHGKNYKAEATNIPDHPLSFVLRAMALFTCSMWDAPLIPSASGTGGDQDLWYSIWPAELYYDEGYAGAKSYLEATAMPDLLAWLAGEPSFTFDFDAPVASVVNAMRPWQVFLEVVPTDDGDPETTMSSAFIPESPTIRWSRMTPYGSHRYAHQVNDLLIIPPSIVPGYPDYDSAFNRLDPEILEGEGAGGRYID